jgi:hypothetical protein
MTPWPPQRPRRACEVFFSYSQKDEELRDKPETAFAVMKRQGIISDWHDRDIEAGTEWKGQIDEHLNSAKVILLLVSPDFIASEYYYELEMKRAMEPRGARGPRGPGDPPSDGGVARAAVRQAARRAEGWQAGDDMGERGRGIRRRRQGHPGGGRPSLSALTGEERTARVELPGHREWRAGGSEQERGGGR